MAEEYERTATVMGDRWVEFRGVDGWEGYSVRVQARLRHGEAKVTGLVVEALSDSSPGLTGQRLRRLPVLDLAREALIYLPPEPAELIGARPVHEILAELSPAERDQLRKNLRQGPRSRAAVPLDDFVKAWRAALNDPRRSTGVRAAVCAELGISTRTYDRYRNQAEAIPGLAPTREENSK